MTSIANRTISITKLSPRTYPFGIAATKAPLKSIEPLRFESGHNTWSLQQHRNMSDFPPKPIASIADEVASLLKSKGEHVSVAETAAGGIISASILATPGASKIYKGGLTLYTLESRLAYAGWTQENIKNYDGPTPQLVAGIAEHVRKTLGSTYTICESGTAGPTASGKTPNRQPGYVAIAVASETGTYTRELSDLGGDRNANMVRFAVESLTLLRDVLKGDAKL